MRKMVFIVVMVFLIFLCCGCSGKQGENVDTEPGGYVEKIVELSAQTTFTELVQGDEDIRLSDNISLRDMVSEDGGEHFQEKGDTLAIGGVIMEYMPYTMKSSPEGNRLFYTYEDGKRICMLATVDDRLIKLESILGAEDVYPIFYYGAGYFYVLQGNSVYQINADTGETKFLAEIQGYPQYLAADKENVYIVCQDGVLLYDLEKGEIAAQQDEILSSFAGGRNDILIYPCENGIYVAVHEGVYWHEMYGDSMEQLVDGSIYGLGNRDRQLAGMAVVENQDSRDSFLIYCSDGVLLRYDYEDDFVPAQKFLRVYSLYEDSQINRGVIAFREKYPDIAVKYEIGMNGSYGMTEEDALKNVATELAAGEGPDILVMDDIPYHSYLEKGVLMDLSEIRGEMTDEEYFNHIIDGMGTENGLYVVPVSFVVPVLVGVQEEIEGIESLTELTNMLESANAESGGCVVGVVNEDEILGLLAQSSMGAWMSGDRTLNLDAVEEFLSQAKRIYEMQIKGVPEELRHLIVGRPQYETILKRRYGVFGIGGVSIAGYNRVSLFPEAPFYGGFLWGEYNDLSDYFSYLKYNDATSWGMLPGQNYGACMPVSLLSINAATDTKEESSLFVKYMLSEEFQKRALLGFPVNRQAYLDIQEKNEGFSQRTSSIHRENGDGFEIDINWPTEEDFRALDKIIEDIKGVNICENRIYNSVISQGLKVLTGEQSVEEAVDAINTELQIYLSE